MSRLKWAIGAVMLASTGGVVAYGFAGQAEAGTRAEGTGAEGTAAVRSANVSPAVPPELSGTREVTIVREQAFEGGLSLDGNFLAEVDDDSGRQLFVPTPLGDDKYLLKAYDRPNGHPAADEPACWQVYRETGQSLAVTGAVCDAADRDQWFTITAQADGTYAISNSSAFLQFSPTSGMILEELGDAPLDSTFRFVDNGPARRPAGG